mmetsp:Transcript_2283/g.3922  ORF Transcript_2283/g.3922 Transcript_2283/m.3922 type:complete len:397 (-) Transcript_2283:54-1244(-)
MLFGFALRTIPRPLKPYFEVVGIPDTYVSSLSYSTALQRRFIRLTDRRYPSLMRRLRVSPWSSLDGFDGQNRGQYPSDFGVGRADATTPSSMTAMPNLLMAGSGPSVNFGFGPRISVDDMNRTLIDSDDPLWDVIRTEAERGAKNVPELASYLYASVLRHRELNRSVAIILSGLLQTPNLQATQIFSLFLLAFKEDPSHGQVMREDLLAAMQRDPAQRHAVGVLLYAKGFHALQCYRLAHWLYRGQGRTALALYLQSIISKAFGVDIHPGARIGRGCFIDHATGIVIGETATVGEHCSLLHQVTLGGTGKESGDRHPKVGRLVLLGAGVTVLGNIPIGDRAQILPGSVVLKPVEHDAIMSGVPAKRVGTYRGGEGPAHDMQHKDGHEEGDTIGMGL